MGIIHVLDETTACQIAAGEVVERPASVVKELMENAQDARARQIDVGLFGGGLERIVVGDDGCGMSPEDATLCFARHATSKLRDIEQLKALGTFGFRGEALAAISAVSKVRLVTRPAQAEDAFCVVVDAGTIEHVGDAAGAPGTVIEVAALFCAVPARLKFLKTPRTERDRAERQVKAQALCNPGIGVRLSLDGREAWSLAAAGDDALDGGRRLARVSACLGVDEVFAVEAQTDLLAVTGYVTAPHDARRDSRGLFVSVNGRPVQDRALSSTVRMAFRTALGPGRFPVASLDVTLDPAQVDINVHPRKAEVRFDDERRVHAHLLGALSDLCGRTPWARRAAHRTYVLKRGDTQTAPGGDPPDASPYDARRERIRAALAKFEARTAPAPGPSRGASAGPAERATPAGPRWCTTLRSRFLVIEDEAGLRLVDGPAVLAAQARDTLRRQAEEGRWVSRTLLFPLRLSLDPGEVAWLEKARERVLARGFDVDGFADDGVIVRAVPQAVCGHNPEAVFRAYLAHKDAPDARLADALAAAFYDKRALDPRELDAAFAAAGDTAGPGHALLGWDELAARLLRGTL